MSKIFHCLHLSSDCTDDGAVTRRDTTMTFMTFVNCDLFNAYACRSSNRCFYEMSIFDNTAFLWAIGGSVIGQLSVIYFPPLQEVFQTESLRIIDLLYIIMLSSTVLVLDTIRKKMFARYFIDSIASGIINKKNDKNRPDESDEVGVIELQTSFRKGRVSTVRSRTFEKK